MTCNRASARGPSHPSRLRPLLVRVCAASRLLRVPRTLAFRAYTVYVVGVEADERRWLVFRRYREWHKLHEQLSTNYANVPAIPAKMLFGNMNPQVRPAAAAAPTEPSQARTRGQAGRRTQLQNCDEHNIQPASPPTEQRALRLQPSVTATCLRECGERRTRCDARRAARAAKASAMTWWRAVAGRSTDGLRGAAGVMRQRSNATHFRSSWPLTASCAR
jgi:hypothetical protein